MKRSHLPDGLFRQERSLQSSIWSLLKRMIVVTTTTEDEATFFLLFLCAVFLPSVRSLSSFLLSSHPRASTMQTDTRSLTCDIKDAERERGRKKKRETKETDTTTHSSSNYWDTILVLSRWRAEKYHCIIIYKGHSERVVICLFHSTCFTLSQHKLCPPQLRDTLLICVSLFFPFNLFSFLLFLPLTTLIQLFTVITASTTISRSICINYRFSAEHMI